MNINIMLCDVPGDDDDDDDDDGDEGGDDGKEISKQLYICSYLSKISLSIAVAVGWLMAFICCCCYFRTRKQLKQAQRIPDYQQMDDEI